MTPEQQERFERANRSIGHVRAIVGKYLLRTATLTEDRKQATDLVLNIKSLTVAVRLRDPKYQRYQEEITIRTSSGGSSPSELDKIIAGNVDWMFYGFAVNGGVPNPWFILDMHIFRKALRDAEMGMLTLACIDKRNTDGSTFRAYRLTSFPRNLIIASSDMEKAALTAA